jgi:hypothetical protein
MVVDQHVTLNSVQVARAEPRGARPPARAR